MANSGIYEDDYSDHDSLYADSPSDGYFSQRDHPQETFVENPSAQAESEAKAREAAENHSSAPSTTSPSRSPRSQVWADESTPILDAGPAPPDYAAATAGRREEGVRRAPIRTSEDGEDEHHFRASSYGSISPTDASTLAPNSTVEPQWPFGNRGSPFVASSTNPEPQWPFGSRGNPFGPHFPFGPGGSPFANTDPSQAATRPQSMRDTRDDEAAPAGVERLDESPVDRTRRKWYSRYFRRRPMSICNILLIVVVVGLMLLLAIVSRHASGSNSRSPGSDFHTPGKGSKGAPGSVVEPGRGKGGGSEGSSPSNAVSPPLIPNESRCHYVSYTNTSNFEFPHAQDFAFTETLDSATYLSGGISGLLVIMPAEPDQTVDIHVSVRFATTEAWRVSEVNCIQAEDSLQLQAPRLSKTEGALGAAKPCMGVGVTVRVRKGVQLDIWRLTTTNMNVQIEEGLSDLLANSTAITTTHGSIKSAFWSSRETRIETTSGSISGTYALHDLLSVRSRSGSINVHPSPQPADPTHPSPALFTAATHSGSVHIAYPFSDPPERDYQTHVSTDSSTIDGSYIFTTAASFTTSSGSITASLLPYTANATSTLQTETRSSSTNFRLLSPFREPGLPVNRLRSEHKSSSGSVNLVYPPEWTGMIEGETRSGSFGVDGRGLKWYTDASGPAGRYVVVGKGDGSSKCEVRTTSGSVGMRVG